MGVLVGVKGGGVKRGAMPPLAVFVCGVATGSPHKLTKRAMVLRFLASVEQEVPRNKTTAAHIIVEVDCSTRLKHMKQRNKTA